VLQLGNSVAFVEQIYNDKI